jgi:hypothetical protein
MKPVAAMALGLVLATLAGGAFAQTGFGSDSVGTFGSTSGRGSFGSAPRAYSSPAPFRPYVVPRAPSMSEPERFKPFKGTHLYSDRGGIDAYPRPSKPKGYIDIYGKSGF